MIEPIDFFVPGPTFVHQDILDEMTAPMIGHRSAAFTALYTSIQPRLQAVFRTRQPVFIAAASGTLAMEIAVASLAEARILHLVCGGFSDRWAQISRSHGLEVDTLEVPWGQGADLDALRTALRSSAYDAVTITHNETSTGVINPLQEAAAIVREESDALVLADCVSSLAGAPVEFDDWGIDFALAGSQKALAVPPGLALFTASERAMERAGTVTRRGFYTDLSKYRTAHEDGSTPTTPAVPIVRALAAQLEVVENEGLEARWERHSMLQSMTATWAAESGFTYASADGVHSPTVACLRPPAGIEPSLLLTGAADRGTTIGSGYGRWKSATIRIGHMGEVMPTDMQRLFDLLDDVVAGATR